MRALHAATPHVAPARSGPEGARRRRTRAGFPRTSPLSMDAHKKPSTKEAAASPAAKQPAAKKQPLKVIRVEDVSVSIFAHERERNGLIRVNYSCGFSRSFKNSAGEWKRTPWFGVDDLGKVTSCAEQAHAFIASLSATSAEGRA
jgi:hypothetical protein